MSNNPDQIAAEFNRRYERAWNETGVTKVIQLYTHDSVLVGYITAVGRSEITDLLQGIFAQGWTGIKVRAVNARRVGDVILVANEYTAIGSGAKAGETLGAKSSHVLINVRGEWLSTMHTAT